MLIGSALRGGEHAVVCRGRDDGEEADDRPPRPAPAISRSGASANNVANPLRSIGKYGAELNSAISQRSK